MPGRTGRVVGPAGHAVTGRRAGQSAGRGPERPERVHAGQRPRRAPGGAVLGGDAGAAGRRLPGYHAVAGPGAGDRRHGQVRGDRPRGGPAAALGLGHDERRLRAVVLAVGGLADGQAVSRGQARDQIDGGVAADVQPGRAGNLFGRVPGPAHLARDPGLAVARAIGVEAARRAVAAGCARDVVEHRPVADVELGQTGDRDGGGPPAAGHGGTGLALDMVGPTVAPTAWAWPGQQ